MHVAIIEPLGVEESLVHRLMGNLEGVTYEYHTSRTTDERELVERVQDADVVVVANVPLGKAVLAHAPRLKMVSVAFTGLDHIDLDWCEAHGVEVVNCAGYSTEAVAEEVFGMAIALMRNLLECDRRTRAGADRSALTFSELFGKTLGVIGNGAIARRVMEIGRVFGMDLICSARSERTLEGVRYASLEEVCAAADVLTVHVPATPETHHLIGRHQLSLMRPTSILINTARGPVVDTDALVDALKEGRIAGAGLDVFDSEPPLDPGLPILEAPNTILAPHIGFATREALDERARMAIEHVREFLQG